MPFRKFLVVLLWIVLPRSGVAVDPLHPLFSDGAVLQQGVEVPVWGTGQPGDAVTVTFAGQTLKTKVDAQGHWQVRLKPLKASAEGRTLTASCGNEEQDVKDILVGEVWICSGQSNMDFMIAGTMNSREESTAAKYPAIRMFTVSKALSATPQTSCRGA